MKNGTLSIAIVSGKGGVGKTNVALNLAYAFYKAKQKVLLMDCDLGLANLDVLLGIAPKVPIEQVILGEADFSEAAVDVESEGFSLLPASSGIDTFSCNDSATHLSFIKKLNAFAAGYDYLLLDAGAGITGPIQNFASMASMRLVVVTPEPTSLTDAYALIKVLSAQHSITDFHVLVNQAASVEEEKMAFTRLAATCKNFLGIELQSLGGIQSDPTMVKAVRRQEPLLKFAPSSPAGKDLVAAAVRVHRYKDTLELDPEMPLKIANRVNA